MKREKTKVRLAKYLLEAPREKQTYFLAMLAVFPPKEYPNSYRYSSNGGPPGCAITFGAAMRECKVMQYQGDLMFSVEHLKKIVEAA